MKRERRSAGPPVVVIVGGGFSGLLTAIHLLRQDPAVRVRLIERTARFGPGRAYGASNPEHLLNVRASNMSAFAERPDHFQVWHGGGGDAFVSRSRYGDYLRSLLADELRDPGHATRLTMEPGEAVAAKPFGTGWRLALSDGARLDADAVVLAVGFLPPSFPPNVDIHDVPSSALIADPWGLDLSHVPDGPVLLVGTGLTMVDAALTLAGSDRRLTAISRRGLSPLGHAPVAPAAGPIGALSSPLEALRTLRRHARAVGWRAAVDSIRPLTADVWMSWTLDQRRRFLRHLRPWWDIHRHRMAPDVAARLAQMRASGQLTVQSARLQSLRGRQGGVEALLRPRGADGTVSALYSAVVNCTSPQGDPHLARGGILADLRQHGLLRTDALGLGVDVDAQLRVIGVDSQASPGLFAVGPLTRGATWEAIAVPDLRHQTALAARNVLASLGQIGEAGATRPASPVRAAGERRAGSQALSLGPA